MSWQSLPLLEQQHQVYIWYLCPPISVPTEVWDTLDLLPVQVCSRVQQVPLQLGQNLCTILSLFLLKAAQNQIFVIKAKVPCEKLRAQCHHT